MKIISLTENTACRPELETEHGLSLYIEACGRKILFDMGQSGVFLRNAEKLGVDLAQVDLAILSHGHYDHGRGLPEFLNLNHTAPVYLHKRAGEGHYSMRPGGQTADIGIDPALLKHPQVRLTEGVQTLFEGAVLFSDVPGNDLRSPANDTLLMEHSGGPVCDTFAHEQNLLLTEDEKCLLVAGCAHRGIVNIVEQAAVLAGKPMDVVIGGFHLSVPSTGGSVPTPLVEAVARRLLAQPETRYYTCHCTGQAAYQTLQRCMGERVAYLAAGGQLEV